MFEKMINENSRAVMETVEKIDAIHPGTFGDSEEAHSEADEILLDAVHPDVAAAYRRLQDRCSWWATA